MLSATSVRGRMSGSACILAMISHRMIPNANTSTCDKHFIDAFAHQIWLLLFTVAHLLRNKLLHAVEITKLRNSYRFTSPLSFRPLDSTISLLWANDQHSFTFSLYTSPRSISGAIQ